MTDPGTHPPDEPAPPPGPEQWQQTGGWPPPGPPDVRGTARPADLGPRFVARLLDFILLGLVTGLLGSLVLVGALVGSDAGVLSGWGMGPRTEYAANALSSVFNAVVALGYFTLMESARGQTVGKMLLKLQTRGPGGATPTVEQALRRNLFTAIPIIGIIPFFGFLSGLLSLAAVITIAVTINRNATRRGWHDDFAGGTTVVRTT